MALTIQPAGAKFTAGMLNSTSGILISSLSTGSVSNSNAETVIGTYTIPANDPTFPGGYYWKAYGNAAESGSPTITIRMRIGGLAGTVIFSPSATSVTAAASGFAIEGFMMFAAIGSSGTFGSSIEMDRGFSGASVIDPGVVQSLISINTTISNALVITAQFSAASTSNTATMIGGALYRQ